ncbi:MFS transporter [uncultured Sulfitobacter sp.]|uniref:MFS transporter n=1 Tax=uncultured Sulfitobacter sp. TaxID=191468 RepID=UPI0030FC78EE
MPVLALMTVPFVFTLGGFVFVGLLEPMAASLGVSIAKAATLQAGYAFACAICGPLIAHVTRNWRKKPLLLATLAFLAVVNGWSAIAPDYATLMGTRILIGGLGALAVPLAVAMGVAAAPAEKRAKTIAAIYAGVVLALMIGIPAGSVIGGLFDWRASLWMTSTFCAVSLVLVAIHVPNLAANVVPKGASAMPARSYGYLAVTLLAFTAMFSMVGFIGPVISALTGFGAYGIAGLQVLIGLSGVVGLRIGATLATHPTQRGLPLLFAGIALGLAILVYPLSIGTASVYGLVAMVLSILIAPTSQFGTAPIVQSRLAHAAGPAATFALAMNGSMVYLGQGLGVACGAFAIAQWGLAAAPVTGAFFALLGLVLSLGMHRATRTHAS